MKKLLLIVLLCGCSGSLVDHTTPSPPTGSGPGTADAGGTDGGSDGGGPPACDTATNCTTPYPGVSEAYCDGQACKYRCLNGKMKCAAGCCDAASISAGSSHTCAVVSGQARCWGGNDQGQLGRDTGAASSIDSDPPPELALKTVTAVASGAAHTCALVAGEGVYCWGDNTFGQLGNSSSGAASGGPTPHLVAGSDGALRIAAGGGHSCLATATQTLCWGKNSQGQIGNGMVETSPRLAPTPVKGVGGAVDLAAGSNHTCAVDATNVLCWGANDAGQIGNGPATPAVATPATIMSSATFVGLGANHGCAGSGNGLTCWGANASAQVDRSGTDPILPTGVLSNVLAMTGGTGHSCAIRRGGGVTCWGLPSQLGLVTTSNSEQDVQLPGPVQDKDITSRSMHTCIIQGGAVMCWGSNDHLQLGIAGAGASATPVLIEGR